MPMKVEAAIVTQKRPAQEFNTDSINVNGKVFDREIIKNGYKGSGVIGGNAYFALTSSDVEGFADAAVAAFSERAETFAYARDPRSVFSGFFEDCRSALMRMEHSEESLVSAGLFAGGRQVVLAQNGNAQIYYLRNSECSLAQMQKADNTVADYNNCVFSDVTADDIFILMTPGTAGLLSQKDLNDICRVSDGSVKRIVNLISKVVLAKTATEAVSVIAVKILEIADESEIAPMGFAAAFDGVQNENEQVSENITETAQSETVNEPVEIKDVPAEEVAQPEDTTSEQTDAIEQDSVSDSENMTEKTAEAEFAEGVKEIYEKMFEDDILDVTESNENISSDTDIENSKENGEDGETRKSRSKLFICLGVMIALSLTLFVVIMAVRGLGTNGGDSPNSETTTLGDESEVFSEENSSEETLSDENETEEESSSDEDETENEEQSTQLSATPAGPSSNEKPTGSTRPSEENTTETVTEQPETSTEEATDESTEEATDESTEQESEEPSLTEQNSTQVSSEAATEEQTSQQEPPIQSQEPVLSESSEEEQVSE